MRVCKVIGCGEKHGSLGYCNRHYQQFKANGRITMVGRELRTPNCSEEELEDWFWQQTVWRDCPPNKPVSNECLIWTRGKTAGYGVFRYHDEPYLAHVYALEISGKPIRDKGNYALHHCDVKLCVNPWHLHWGTSKTNAIEREIRGLAHDRSGVKNPRAKLDWGKVRKIRKMRKAGATLSSLASRFSTPISTIDHVVSYRTWKEAA